MQEKNKVRKEEQIKYNELHKDEIEKMEQEKEQVRKETNIEKCKTWRNNNADGVKENGKQYYEKTKDILYKSHDCECGGKYCIGKKIRHERSNRHQTYFQTYLESLNQQYIFI